MNHVPLFIALLEAHRLQHHGQITPLSVACTMYSHEPAQVSLQTLCVSQRIYFCMTAHLFLS